MRVWIEEGPPIKEQRPGVEAGALQTIHGGESEAILASTDARCRRCGRVLYSKKAIEAGAGWRCAARLAAEAGAA